MSLQFFKTLVIIRADFKSCSLDGLNSSEDLPFSQSLFYAFGDSYKGTNYDWSYHYLFAVAGNKQGLHLLTLKFTKAD